MPTCTTSRSRRTTSPTSPRSTRSAAISRRSKERRTGRSSTRRSRRSTCERASCAGNGTASTTSAPRSPKSKRRPDATPWDYFHLNSIDPEGGTPITDGDLLISARSTWAGYQLEGGSGKILWRLGGNRSSFKMGPGTKMAWQHDGRMLPNGEVTFFDDGSNPPIHRQSRGLRIALDLKTHEARLASAYTHPGARCSRRARATCRRSRRERRRGLRRGARDQRVRRRRRAAVRRPPAVRHDLLPRLSLPLERAPAEPACGPRRPEQHGRRDDRARELERRDRGGVLARARGEGSRRP